LGPQRGGVMGSQGIRSCTYRMPYPSMLCPLASITPYRLLSRDTGLRVRQLHIAYLVCLLTNIDCSDCRTAQTTHSFWNITLFTLDPNAAFTATMVLLNNSLTTGAFDVRLKSLGNPTLFEFNLSSSNFPDIYTSGCDRS
jgi:hypothetical protein